MNKIYKKIFSLASALLVAGSMHAQTELVTDGGFEAGPGGGAWTESSTNFGTPLCDLTACGTGTGTGPYVGTYWAWFGGIGGTTETGSLEQSFVIPSGGTATLTFWLEQILCDSPQDFIEVSIDGNVVFSSDGSSTLCGVLGYSLQTVDISSYADGASHTLAFNSTTLSVNGGETNIFVDNVSVIHSTGGGPTCPDIITDGNFELGPGGGTWTETSTNFGTPLCSVALCTNGSGTGPHGGTFWAWFGGFAGGTETATVSQSFVFPAGDSITLSFWLEQIACDGPTDFLEVTVDGNQVFMTDGASPLCGVLGYSLQTVDLSSYADGNSHTIEFNSTTFSVNAGVSNFFVDDVVVSSCSNTPPPVVCADSTEFNGVNVVIPDDDPVGIDNLQAVTGVGGTTLGTDVELISVCFDIDHTWVGDLLVTLTAPNGTSVVLLDRPGVPALPAGCDGDNVSVCVEAGTGNEMENVCNNLPAISGTFTAANGSDLNSINAGGGSPNGNWTLNVSDNVADDFGTIVNWSLVFSSGPVASWDGPDTLCATDPAVSLNPLVTGTTGGTWSGTGVTGSTFDPTGLSGNIAVTYTVVDTALGCSDAQTNNIFVAAGAPTASFTSTILSLTANFTNTSTGAGSYSWDFGDSQSSTAENPTHTYSAAGTYNVTLIVTNACGTDSISDSIVVLGCPDVMLDGGFELGPGGGTWTEFSTNFGTPVCDVAGCTNGTGTGPHAGTFWSWFGGTSQFEEGSMTQTVTIADNSTATLSFWLEQIVCDSPSDFLKVAVDGDTLFTTDGSSPLCGVLGYSLQTVNLDAYADGNPHTISFFSRIYAINGGGSNFFVDDISLIVCPFIGINNPELDKHVSVMPVPARDYVEVKFSDVVMTQVEIEVTDIIGQSVYKVNVANINDDQSERIDVSKWSKGIYMLKVSSEGNSVIRKIVVQ